MTGVHRRRRRVASIGSLCAVALVATACSASDGDASQNSVPGVATTIAEDDGVVFSDADSSSESADGSESTEPGDEGDGGDGVEPAPTTTLFPEIEQVPADEVEVVGSPPPTFVYTEEVPPAPSVVATLCNLDADFIRSLRVEDDEGRPVVDDDLRSSILVLRDSVSLWRDLELSFPETADDVSTADEISLAWNDALAADSDGDADRAMDLMQDADDLIDQLPDATADGTCEF